MSSSEYAPADVFYFDNCNAQAAVNIYEPLHPQELRVITIEPCLPNKSSEEIRCYLKHVSLQSQPLSYSALSYVWGGKSAPGNIRLNGEKYLVTKNLLAALEQLRRSDARTELWIDALCINQSDVAERDVQVQLMNEIYTAANLVILWLGIAADNSDLAFNIINHGAEHGFDTAWVSALFNDTEWGHNDPVFEAVMELLTREYWNRLWIVQEIACAARVNVYCGQSRVFYQDIIRFTESMTRHDMSENVMYSRTARIIRLYIKEVGPAGLKAIGSARAPEIYEDPVWVLARNAANKKCFDSRDRIYACLGLFEQRLRQIISVDYESSPKDVVIRATAAIIQFTRRLDLLLLKHRIPNAQGLLQWETDIPSWAPALDDHFGTHEIFLDFLDPRYEKSACGNLEANSLFIKDNSALRVRGVIIGTIKRIQEREYRPSDYMYGKPEEQIKLVEYIFAFREYLGDKVYSQDELIHFWLTILGCFFSQHNVLQTARGQKPGTEVYKLADIGKSTVMSFGVEMQNIYKQIQERQGIVGRIQSLLGSPILNAQQRAFIEPLYRYFDHRILFNFDRYIMDIGINPEVVHDKVFRAINIGVGPVSAREDDIVCVLFGCKVPTILRQCNQYYQVVGHAMLSHFMDGEVLEGRIQGVSEPCDFTLI